MQTFAEIVRSRVGDDAVGLRFEDRQWTWDEVVAESATRAAALTASVPAPEGRQIHVGVLLENVPDFVFWLGAGALAGAVVIGINASRSGPEIAQDVRHADVDLIITESRLRHLVEDPAHGVPAERVHDVDTEAYAEWLAPHRGAPLPDARPAPEDIAMLLFSSGSTGAPKAVIVGQGRLGRLVEAIVGRVRMERSSVTYLCMPLFHGNAVMMNLAPAMAVGATVAMTRKFSASAFADDIHRVGATYVNYVGRALSYALSRPEDPRDRTSTLQLAFGTEASEADVARFSERFGCEVMEGYGLSEGVFRINRTPDTPTGSLGLPAGGLDVRILDEATGEECPRARFDEAGRLVDPAAVGQIVAVGLAHTFEGYYKNPEAMADRVKGADFWSGDLGYRDADGFFYFAGRSSDWLRVDSENFSAAPVERILARAEGVAVAPVFAVPDPRTGDRVMTAVELEPGADFDPVAFGAYLAEQPDMGAKWWPSFVRIVDSMPLTGSGKINKAPLRHAAWQTTDPVFVRVGRTAEYVALDEVTRKEIEREFLEHGRAAHLPAPLA
ncbi:AMP-binding protein [Nocardioides sp. dk4132]|uniref:AMP-binding protein n=1 Tax=unclassified Nocardioides TaxID=2615069 RepID=UPI001295215D|nr:MULTISPECIES: AMP-binding protein [unclassified Nocardioides]MQW74339.1 AMP-binding protein [Nocardioides sp. dk4132]QGA06287.1 AMP-binding protein [Nocardioides sp. dk884]